MTHFMAILNQFNIWFLLFMETANMPPACGPADSEVGVRTEFWPWILMKGGVSRTKTVLLWCRSLRVPKSRPEFSSKWCNSFASVAHGLWMLPQFQRTSGAVERVTFSIYCWYFASPLKYILTEIKHFWACNRLEPFDRQGDFILWFSIKTNHFLNHQKPK